MLKNGGGKYAQVKGYEIGGKTGTSEPDPNHKEDGYVASFLAIAPVENTKLVTLLALYNPQGKSIYGGHIAAPVVSQILSEVLPYLNIDSTEKDENTNTKPNDDITLPNLKGKIQAEAKKTLQDLGLTIVSNLSDDDIVENQMPAAGVKLKKNSYVNVYNEKTKQETEVPNLKGLSINEAKNILAEKKLNISYSGDSSGIINTQSLAAKTKALQGTIINVTLQEKVGNSQH